MTTEDNSIKILPTLHSSSINCAKYVTPHSWRWNSARLLPLTPADSDTWPMLKNFFLTAPPRLFPSTTVFTVFVIAYWLHDLTRLRPLSWSGRGRSTAFPLTKQRRWAEAEALEGAQQVEAAVLAPALGVDDLGELAGQRHLPPEGAQVAGVLGALGQRKGGKTAEQL